MAMQQEPITSSQQKIVWLLSPYHTGSHAAWAKAYQRHSRHQVELITMAGRFWKWRMQGGAIELAHEIRARLGAGERPQAIFTTDMVNVAALLGLMRRELAGPLRNVPILLYMHENQLTYPWREGEKPDLTYAMINWTSQLAADRILFNSRYHMDSWFSELPKLLKHYPDYNHLGLIEKVWEQSQVLPVGIECDPVDNDDGSSHGAISSADGLEAPLILWNQRWEYDKQPQRFFALLYRLKDAGIDFRLAVAGENFRNVPAEFEEAQKRLAEQIVHWGYVESYAGYLALLGQADLVVSTAIHEFFGISVLEAIVAGAFPLLPNRLSYPELIPEALHPACLYEDEEALFAMAAQRLEQPRPAPPSLQAHVVERFHWPVVATTYDELVDKAGENALPIS